MKKNYTWQVVLKLSVFLILIGRAYQFYFFGAPFRAILWDESLISPLVESLLNITWEEYATNTNYSDNIDLLSKLCGAILFVGSMTSLFWQSFKYYKLKKTIISMCIFILVILGICIYKDKNYSLLQVFELFIQISLPVVLVFFTTKTGLSSSTNTISLILKIAVSATFIAHGLYAMGIPFYPGHFIDMTIGITGLTEDQSKVFLSTVGALDVLAATLIYFKKTARYALAYILIWGLLTALARIVAGFNSSYVLVSIHNSLYATVYRLPHGLIAAIIILMTYSQSRISNLNHHEA